MDDQPHKSAANPANATLVHDVIVTIPSLRQLDASLRCTSFQLEVASPSLFTGFNADQKAPSCALVAAGAFGFLTLIQLFDGPD